MYFTTKEISEFGEASLVRFLEQRIPEGRSLDYKQAMPMRELPPERRRGVKREFLKDITSFANAQGGDIIIGAREPSDEMSVMDQIVGLTDASGLAKDLERIASSGVDPRIPALQIVPVILQNSKEVIVVHIPPSIARPHRVDHEGYSAFYIRHSESSLPMTTHEIRHSVLTSVSAEARAKAYLEEREADALAFSCAGKAAFLLQAMPLIEPENQWDTFGELSRDILRGQGRETRFSISLATNCRPEPTIDGLKAFDSRKEETWVTEVHRSGYISALYFEPPSPLEAPASGERQETVVQLYDGHCHLFRAFCFLCSELLEANGLDCPYVMRCRFLNAAGVHLYCRRAYPNKYRGPWRKAVISWHDQIRQTGQRFDNVADRWCELMFNAFGEQAPPELMGTDD